MGFNTFANSGGSGTSLTANTLNTLIATGTTTIEPKGTLHLNVKDYGAVGDGVTDDTAAIQSAINDASSKQLPLKFPCAKYLLTAAVWLKSNLIMIGNGSTIYMPAKSTATTMFYGKNITNIRVSGFKFISSGLTYNNGGAASNCSSSNIRALQFDTVSNVMVTDVYGNYLDFFLKCDQACTEFTFDNIRCDNTVMGILFVSNSSDLTVSNFELNLPSASSYTVDFRNHPFYIGYSTSRIKISNGTTSGGNGFGVQCQSNTYGNVSDVVVENVIFHDSAGCFMWWTYCNDITMDNVVFTGKTNSGRQASHINIGNSTRMKFTNVTLQGDCTANGNQGIIDIWDSSDVEINGLSVNSTTAIALLAISGNSAGVYPPVGNSSINIRNSKFVNVASITMNNLTQTYSAYNPEVLFDNCYFETWGSGNSPGLSHNEIHDRITYNRCLFTKNLAKTTTSTNPVAVANQTSLAGLQVFNDCRHTGFNAFINSDVNRIVINDSYSTIPTSECWALGSKYVRRDTGALMNCSADGALFSATRANLTSYVQGQWIAWDSGTTVWECITAGITGSSSPDISAISLRGTVTDGTAVFMLRSFTKATFSSQAPGVVTSGLAFGLNGGGATIPDNSSSNTYTMKSSKVATEITASTLMAPSSAVTCTVYRNGVSMGMVTLIGTTATAAINVSIAAGDVLYASIGPANGLAAVTIELTLVG